MSEVELYSTAWTEKARPKKGALYTNVRVQTSAYELAVYKKTTNVEPSLRKWVLHSQATEKNATMMWHSKTCQALKDHPVLHSLKLI